MTARRVLARAALQLGGMAELAARLEMSPTLLRHYIEGSEPIPDRLFLAAIDVVLQELPNPRKPARADELSAPRPAAAE
jgi:AcrR family transcriptional regulator